MTVGRICQREVDLASPADTVQAAAQRMGARSVGTLLVLDEDKRPIGIFSDRDLAVRVLGRGLPYDTPVSEVMTPNPHRVSEETPIEDALALMRREGFRRLPVVDERGCLAGMLSLDDVLSLLAEEFGHLGGILNKTSPRSLAQV